MHEQNMAILKGLVSVAWADGKVAQEELEVIEALLDAFEATPSEATEVRTYAKEHKSLDDIPITDLSFDDRRVLLQHAVCSPTSTANSTRPRRSCSKSCASACAFRRWKPRASSTPPAIERRAS